MSDWMTPEEASNLMQSLDSAIYLTEHHEGSHHIKVKNGYIVVETEIFPGGDGE